MQNPNIQSKYFSRAAISQWYTALMGTMKQLRNPDKGLETHPPMLPPTQFTRLEPRILYDGSLGAVAAEAAAILGVDALAVSGEEAFASAAAAADQESREVAVIDTGIKNHAMLENSAREAGMEVILISTQDKGLETLAQQLQGQTDISALHILSHGDQGRIFLGTDILSSATLDDHSLSLAVISQSLTAQADILLYGCRVGEDDGGVEFIEDLAMVTHADIAASDDNTGAQSLGGDWDLEVQIGDIETESPFTAKTLADFSEIFAYSGTVNFNNVIYAGNISGGASSDATINVGGYTMVLDGKDTPGRVVGGLHKIAKVGIHYGLYDTEATFSFTNGEVFDIGTMYLYNMSWDATYQGFRNFTFTSDQGHSYTLPTLDYFYGATATLNFTNITELTITAAENTGFQLYFDNMVINNLRPANQAPTLSTPPSDLTIIQGTLSDIDLSDVSVADANNDPLTLTLVASSGTFANPADGASVGAGVTETWVSNTTITLTGSAADINTYLDTADNIQYQPDSGLSGNNAATITLSLSDGSLTLPSNPLVYLDIPGTTDSSDSPNHPSGVLLVEDSGEELDRWMDYTDEADYYLSWSAWDSEGYSDSGGQGYGFGGWAAYYQGGSWGDYSGQSGGGGTPASTPLMSAAETGDTEGGTQNTEFTPDPDSISLAEGNSHTFSPDDFGTADPGQPDTLSRIQINSQSLGAGTLTLDGVPVNNGDWIPASDISKLVYTAMAEGSDSVTVTPEYSNSAESSPRTFTLNTVAASQTAMETDLTTAWTSVRIGEQGLITFGETGMDTGALRIGSVEVDPVTQTLTLAVQSSGTDSVTDLQASLSDGTPLPAWLSFNADGGTFTGIPPQGTQSLTLKLRYTTSDGDPSALDVEIQFDQPQGSTTP